MIEHADALEWLPQQGERAARLVVFDPPYSIRTPQYRPHKAGSEQASSVFGPMSFMWRAARAAADTLIDGGVLMAFCDVQRLPDVGYMLSTTGLRVASVVAWCRNRPGTGAIFRGSWSPIVVASRGSADAIDSAAVRDWIVAENPGGEHRHEKPRALYDHVFARVLRPGDLVLDPFAGSGSSRAPAEAHGATWRGCDIDPQWAGVA